jgi:acyl carrier protein
MSVDQRVSRLLALVLDVAQVPGQYLARETEPKWDSLKHMEIIFAIEDEFGVHLDEARMASIQSHQDIVALIEQLNAS